MSRGCVRKNAALWRSWARCIRFDVATTRRMARLDAKDVVGANSELIRDVGGTPG
jgi:hypothetical protein